MPRSRAARLGVALTAATVLSACAGDAVYVSPDFPFLQSYSTATGAPVLLDNVEWWARLEDPVLNRMITLALRDGVSLALARTRVEQAFAAREAVPGATLLSPSAGLRAEGTENTGPNVVAPLRLGLNFMLDPWGVRQNGLRAADARIEAADAELDAARLLLIYNTANAYLDLRYRQRLVALANAEMINRRHTLRMVETLREAEEATILETTRSRARLAELRAQMPGLEAAVAAALNQLSVLAGAAPGDLPSSLASALRHPDGQPRPTLSPDVGIPADLLRNRPDIRIAERRYAAAVAEIDAAEGQRYPTLSLTGAITLDALGGGMDYFFGPALQFPDITGDGPRAAVAQARAAARGTYEDWRGTVLQALLEVENALVNYNAATVSTTAAADAVRLYGETLSLTRTVVEEGEATLGDMIDAEESLAGAERRLTELRLQRGLAFVELNVRLGAGHATQAVPEAGELASAD